MTALGVSSCFEDTAFDTTCTIESYQQVVSGDDYTPLSGVVAHAFAGTTSQWEVASYEDALAGVVTSIANGTTATAFATSTEIGEGLLSLPLDREEMILVAVDPASGNYAVRDYELPVNMAQLEITLPFLPWKAADYTVGKWSFKVPEFESLSYFIDTYQQQNSDDEEVESLAITKSYVFVAEPDDLVIANYEDALAGRATSPSTSQTYLAYAEGTPVGDEGNQILFSLTEPTVLMVVVDPASCIYAYYKYTLSSSVRATRATLTFNLWAEDNYTSSSWNYVVLYGNMSLSVFPMTQLTDSSEAESLAMTKCYAFPTTADDLSFESWDDILDGAAISLSSGEAIDYVASAGSYTSSSTTELKLTLHESYGQVALVLVDSEGSRYAYCDYTIVNDSSGEELEMLFMEWQSGDYDSGDWRVIEVEQTEEESDSEEEEDENLTE